MSYNYYKSLKAHFHSLSKSLKTTVAAFFLMVRSVSNTRHHSESERFSSRMPSMGKPYNIQHFATACKAVKKYQLN